MTKAARTLAHVRHVLRTAIIRAQSLDEALKAGTLLGEINWRNNDGLLAEEALEQALFEQHGQALADAALEMPTATTDWLHVISAALTTGGHTRLLSFLVAAQKRTGADAAVAVTRHAPESFVADTKAAGANLHLLTGTLSARATQLLALGRSAKRVVLHIHPDDLSAALAARQLRAEGIKVLFVNHADHVFSYGVGAADLCLEVSGYGWRLSEARRPAKARHFLGIPVTETAEDIPLQQVTTPEGPIFSMGSPNKYKPASGYDFPAFISDILDRTDVSAEIAGPSPADPWWSDACARHGTRLRLLGPVPFAEASARLAAASCYVDSFPINGGTAFPQALLAGKTVFGPGADTGGYNLADALRFPSVEAMSERLCTFLQSGTPLEGEQEIRARIAAEFNADTIARKLSAAADGTTAPPPDELLATPRPIDWYPKQWQSNGVVTLWKKAQHAPVIGLRARLSMALHIFGRSHVRGGPQGIRAMLRWILKGRF